MSTHRVRHASWYWRSRERGVAGIEAALLLPLIVFMIFGFMELYQYHRAVALLDRVAFTIANGVAMQVELSNRGQCQRSDDICVYGTVANDLFQPLDYAHHGRLMISAYGTTTPPRGGQVTWKAQPEWRQSFRGTASSAAVVTRLQDKTSFPPARVGDTLVVAEVFYDYEPFVISSRWWAALGGTTELYSRFFFRPRFNDLQVLQ